MPEHIHLIISEAEKGDPSRIVQSDQAEGFARRVLRGLRKRRLAAQQEPFGRVMEHVWQHRFYDFKRVERGHEL